MSVSTESLQADNAGIDLHIATLKAALTRAGLKEAVFDPQSACRTIVRTESSCKLIFGSEA